MGMSLFGNSGDKTTKTETTNISDSGNQSYNWTQAYSDVGNTSVVYGQPAQSGVSGAVGNLGPYILAGAFILGGLFMLNRKG